MDSLRSLLESGEASRYNNFYLIYSRIISVDFLHVITNLFFLISPSYDFAFVDADKRMYEEYFELLLKLVRFSMQFTFWACLF